MYTKQLTTIDGHTFVLESAVPFAEAATAVMLDAKRSLATTNRVARFNSSTQVAQSTKRRVNATTTN